MVSKNQSVSDNPAFVDFVSRIVKVHLGVNTVKQFANEADSDLGKSGNEGSSTFTDFVKKSVSKKISDSMTFNDKLLSNKEVDKLTFTDTLNKAVSKTVSDIINIVDTTSKAIAKSIADGISIQDSTGKGVAKSISDVIALNDTSSKTSTKVLNEAITINDSITKAVNKAIEDDILLTDSIVATKGGGGGNLQQAILDSITFTDGVILAVIHVVTASGGGITTQTPGVYNPYYGGASVYNEVPRKIIFSSPLFIWDTGKVTHHSHKLKILIDKKHTMTSKITIKDIHQKNHKTNLVIKDILKQVKSSNIILLNTNDIHKSTKLTITNKKSNSHSIKKLFKVSVKKDPLIFKSVAELLKKEPIVIVVDNDAEMIKMIEYIEMIESLE